MSDGIDVRELAMMLADDIEGVVADLHIDVRSRSRRRLVCFAPWNNHHNPKLEIEIYPIKGRWNDWIEGKWGDALGLVACALSGTCEPKNKAALREAINWAKERFGVAGPGYDKAAWAKRREEAELRAKKATAAAARELAQKRATGKGLWLAAQELKPHTAVWDYFEAREIHLAQLPRMPRALRFAPEAPWYDDAGQIQYVGPAVMAAMTLPDGRFGSLHRTWVNPERPGEKADLDPPRKMWPESEGAAIRLWRGDSGLSISEATKRGLIEDSVVCEGIEDGLSIALMTPELRVDACGSLPGLLAYVPGKFTRCQIVAADNDWGKPQAQALLNRACKRLAEEFGKQVRIARSPEGKDFNDLLRGA